MPVPSSGQIRISDLVAEFGGDAPHAISEYYRGGGRVPSNNTNVPTSGQFRMSNGYGAVNEIAIAATSGANVDLSSLFGANWTSTVPKRLTIGSGVTIGGTGSSAAIIIPSNMAGTLEIDNAGSILGFGGAANAGAGGTAISNSASGVVINNTGLLAGGGGGGGIGGTGGQGGNGSYSTTVNQGPSYSYSSYYWRRYRAYLYLRWAGGSIYSGPNNYSGTSYSVGGYTWYRGSLQSSDPDFQEYMYAVSVSYSQTNSSTGGSGGSGGSGGAGQGYNQSNASGSSGSGGSAGGTNAGAGGSGGTGGSGGAYGSSGGTGATGNTGANGNASSGSGGSSGSSGGAAGAAVIGTSVTMNNTGTLYGAVA